VHFQLDWRHTSQATLYKAPRASARGRVLTTLGEVVECRCGLRFVDVVALLHCCTTFRLGWDACCCYCPQFGFPMVLLCLRANFELIPKWKAACCCSLDSQDEHKSRLLMLGRVGQVIRSSCNSGFGSIGRGFNAPLNLKEIEPVFI
jgi:hypothetical protein